MSLIDTDKNSEDRGNPSPNTHDTILEGANKSHATISSHYTTDADTNAGRLQMGNKRIVGNDGTTNRALLGYNSTTNTWGLFGSKSGQDVLTVTPSNYTFSTDYNSFKIVLTGTANINGNATAGVPVSTTIAHNLGFIPIPLCFTSRSGQYVPLPTYTGITTSGGNVALNAWIECSTDATNLYLSLYSGSTTNWGTIPIRYYLLAETAN